MTRPPAGVTTAAVATGLVVISSFVLSYAALVTVGQAAGFGPRISWLYPVSLDGLLAVGMVAAVLLREARLRTRAYVWLLIGVGIAASVAGNAAHSAAAGRPLALSGWPVWLAGAVPPLALAAALHLLIVVVRHHRQPTEERTRPPAPPPDTGPSRPDMARPVSAPATSNGHKRTPDTAAKVRTYLSGHPEARTADIAAAVGVSDRQVRRVLAEGRT